MYIDTPYNVEIWILETKTFDVSYNQYYAWWVPGYMRCLYWPTLKPYAHSIKWNKDQGPLLLPWIIFKPAWVSNLMLSKVFDEITYPFPNFNGFTVESFGMDE